MSSDKIHEPRSDSENNRIGVDVKQIQMEELGRKTVTRKGGKNETREILSDRNLVQNIREGNDDAKCGRLIPYEKFRKKHRLPQT